MSISYQNNLGNLCFLLSIKISTVQIKIQRKRNSSKRGTRVLGDWVGFWSRISFLVFDCAESQGSLVSGSEVLIIMKKEHTRNIFSHEKYGCQNSTGFSRSNRKSFSSLFADWLSGSVIILLPTQFQIKLQFYESFRIPHSWERPRRGSSCYYHKECQESLCQKWQPINKN